METNRSTKRLRVAQVHFDHFRCLCSARVELEPLTLLIGPNNSGKTTVLQGLEAFRNHPSVDSVLTLGGRARQVEVRVGWAKYYSEVETVWVRNAERVMVSAHQRSNATVPEEVSRRLLQDLNEFRVYRLNPNLIVGASMLTPAAQLAADGSNFAAALDSLRDEFPEKFEQLNVELQSWFPEFDRIQFETPAPGNRRFKLRRASDKVAIPAVALSAGTQLALTVLALGYLKDVPRFFAIEEPEVGVHPRLLRRIFESVHRLTHPEDYGDSREPKQIILTTHSPLLLDLFREMPESIMIAKRQGACATFSRLSDMPELNAVLGDSSLSEAWYAGVLGGVPNT